MHLLFQSSHRSGCNIKSKWQGIIKFVSYFRAPHRSGYKVEESCGSSYDNLEFVSDDVYGKMLLIKDMLVVLPHLTINIWQCFVYNEFMLFHRIIILFKTLQ